VLTALRAADAIVQGGAIAVRCGTSGLAHGADGFQALLQQAEAARDGSPTLVSDLAEALFQCVVRLALAPVPMTIGMQAFARPDVVLDALPDVGLDAGLNADRAVATLERVALGLIRGAEVPRGRPDTRSLFLAARNPHGVVSSRVPGGRGGLPAA
jgi:hypothetical protein